MEIRRADILVLTGGQGGFEIIVNQTTDYLSVRGWRVRYVQLLLTDTNWTTKNAAVVNINLDRNSVSFEKARAVYADILRQTDTSPDVIFASGWPYLIYVAKGAASDASLSVPVVAWPHDDLRYYEEGGGGGVDMFRFADMCFAYNDTIAGQIYKMYPDKIIYRIRYTYDKDRIYYSEARNTYKLAVVGRLTDKKAIPIILYALELTKAPWELVVVGDGEDRFSLKSLTEELQLQSRVLFMGWQDNPWKTVFDCRALLVSSLYEGGPLTILEALASGMQVISTPVGIAEDLIRDSRVGRIVQFGRPDILADAIDELSKSPFTHETSVACTDAVKEYLADYSLADFMDKTDACAKRTIHPGRYYPDSRE